MKVINIGDTHFPFEDQSRLNKLYVEIEKEQPDVVIQGGDLYDQYMFSRHDNEMNLMKPDEELDKARKAAKKFWKKIQSIVPNAECYQIIGNHDTRILRQCLRKFPEIYSILKETHKALYTFDGVQTATNDRDYLIFDGVVYCHGWMAKHMDHFDMPVVRQHDHKAWMLIKGIDEAKGRIFTKESYKVIRNNNTMFEISCGMYGDDTKLPFEYTLSKRTNWRPAISIVTPEYAELRVL